MISASAKHEFPSLWRQPWKVVPYRSRSGEHLNLVAKVHHGQGLCSRPSAWNFLLVPTQGAYAMSPLGSNMVILVGLQPNMATGLHHPTTHPIQHSIPHLSPIKQGPAGPPHHLRLVFARASLTWIKVYFPAIVRLSAKRQKTTGFWRGKSTMAIPATIAHPRNNHRGTEARATHHSLNRNTNRGRVRKNRQCMASASQNRAVDRNIPTEARRNSSFEMEVRTLHQTLYRNITTGANKSRLPTPPSSVQYSR